mmetsp:Transcript_1178/g.2640  ORF Transcript_1178/g.2640 Transcript_1178/m.2640 type:complete len:246 (+) Transcript_1178:460-1197(+)
MAMSSLGRDALLYDSKRTRTVSTSWSSSGVRCPLRRTSRSDMRPWSCLPRGVLRSDGMLSPRSRMRSLTLGSSPDGFGGGTAGAGTEAAAGATGGGLGPAAPADRTGETLAAPASPTAGGAQSELGLAGADAGGAAFPGASGSMSTTSLHLAHGFMSLRSVIIRPTSASSFGLSCLLYKISTTRPTFGLTTGTPRAVLTPNWTAPPRRSKRSAGAFETNCSQAGMPDLKIRPGRPQPLLKENFSE